jgi:alcohol dehydrogenase class IV
MLRAPHGAVCAALLPHVMAANVRALSDSGGTSALERAAETGWLLAGRRDADAAVGWLRAAVERLGVPRLGQLGVTASDVAAIAGQALRSSSMRGNPVALGEAQLSEILLAAR